jgi:hypothetical protein
VEEKNNMSKQRPRQLARTASVLILIFGLLAAFVVQAAQVTINVSSGLTDTNNDPIPVGGFRYVIQEDTTFAVDPNNPATVADDMLSLSFHASNQPVAKDELTASGLSGNTDSDSIVVADVPPGRYYISVLPYSGHSIGGSPVDLTLGDATVEVAVQANPIPTAQIAVFLFQDNWPVNGAPDLPEEDNPGADGELVDWSEFNIILEEPAGRYGVAGGQVIADAFGNPIGTTYLPDCNPNEADCVDVLGDGTIQPDPVTGTVLIKNLAPGKYGIKVSPPAGQGWQQTSTIEGSPVIDAWVKANEPPFFVEFGFPGPHVFVGFTKPIDNLPAGGAATISGLITDMHMSRPPSFQFFSGRPFPSCWVALNEAGAALGQAYYAAPCNPDSTFAIPAVPDGSYSMTIWDSNLDVVIAQQPITVSGGLCNGGDCNLGEVAVFNWFTRLNTAIFTDTNQDGFWDVGPDGIPGTIDDVEPPAGAERGPVQIRWRDGTIYQVFGTDNEGFAPFDEVFPFFHWQVAEVGFTRDKVTGATFVVDAGGEVDTTTEAFPGFGELTPQEQCNTPTFDPVTGLCLDPAINPNTGDNLSRTELGPVLTQAFQGFLGQTSVLQFGTTPYLQSTLQLVPPQFPPQFIGENGGISGMVLYGTTRAENNPEDAVAEEWEPGVPRVQVALYADGDIDSLDLPPTLFPGGIADIDWNGNGVFDSNDNVIDDINGNGSVDLADVDNYPLGNFPGIEDLDRNGNGLFDFGDAINVTWTDSWDDSLPTGCQGRNNVPGVSVIDPPVTDDRCFDGLRNFNQVRPGVFDGGWAFDAYSADALTAAGRGDLVTKLSTFYTDRIALAGTTAAGIQRLPAEWMLPGEYIVETATPPGYKLLQEEHKNVDFGDEYVPSLQAFPQPCVGDLDPVPYLLAMATKDGSGDPAQIIPGINEADALVSLYTSTADPVVSTPLCDKKAVQLTAGQNAAADFFVMTDVPIAGNVSGVILNDLANEFNPNSPAFGEKYSPPFVPVGFYDWAGAEVNRVYGDQYGRFNALLPSTYTANLPQPSGMSPNMIVSCMNDAGPIPNPLLGTLDPDGNIITSPELVIDPFFDPRFSQFCYTFQYMPGAITYLDTPVESIAAFANPVEYPVDCERPDGTPMISSVTRADGTGPFVVAGANQQIEVRSMGLQEVQNPEWDGLDQATRTILRDYRFTGGNKDVVLEDADGNRIELNGGGNDRDLLVRTVQAAVSAGEYQVIVVTNTGQAAGTETPIGVTLTVGTAEDTGLRPDGTTYAVHRVTGPAAYPATPIQDAIDAAAPGDLILVPPGAYDELVVMWKPVKLQGWGAGEVFINARQSPTEKILDWRAKVEGLVAGGLIDPLPGQDLPLPGFPALGAPIFATEEGAGIFVVGSDSIALNRFRRLANRGSRIDGFTIVGASQGGAIVANGYTGWMNIGNNRMEANAGFFGGGVRLGHPTLTFEDPVDGLIYPDAWNDRIRIHHNHIVQNGNTFGGAGAGLSIHTGADGYRVQENWICGNFSQGDGAGIGHLGVSNGGLIEDNLIIFNESFQQAGPVNGAGIMVGGKPALQPDPVTGLLLSPGSGGVVIDANLIRGNLAGAGDGGGIRVQSANGLDVANSLDNTDNWYRVAVYNNMINNNVAGLAGGGISVEDSVRAVIRNNQIANNDSTATTALAFNATDPLNQGGNNVTTPQPAGIVSRLHSPDMAALMIIYVNPAALGNRVTQQQTFSDAVLRDNIVYQNRSFYWTNFDDPLTAVIETGLVPATCLDPTDPLNDPTCDINAVAVDDYTDDFGVLDGLLETADRLNPRYSLLTDNADNAFYLGLATNITGDPSFVNPYFNTSRDAFAAAEFKTLQTAAAFDEGGNFIQVTFGPLSLVDATATGNAPPLFDYHIEGSSAAVGAGGTTPGLLNFDFDNEPRQEAIGSDIGADEVQ